MSDRERIEQRLPTDASYWDGLASRVESGASAELARRRAAGERAPVWWARPALSPALALAAFLAVGAAWWLVPAGAAADDGPLVSRALLPGDPLAASLLEPVEPVMADLIRRGAGGTPEED